MNDVRGDTGSATRTLALSTAFRLLAWIVAILGIVAGVVTGFALHSQTCDLNSFVCAPRASGADIAVIVASVVGGALFWAGLLAALAAILEMQARSFLELCNVTDLLAEVQGYGNSE